MQGKFFLLRKVAAIIFTDPGKRPRNYVKTVTKVTKLPK